MSVHSRSSSEIETTTLRDVLPKFFKDFMDDFSFDDVKDSVRDIFSEDEMQMILEETDEKKQNMQLFWILYQSESYIEQFLDAIKVWYPWLTEYVREERKSLSKDTEKYIQSVMVLRSIFHQHVDLNVHRMEYYWQIYSALKKLTPYKYVVISGELRVGKKWLAVDAISEYSVMKSMGFKIFWLDVCKCTSREEDLSLLQQLRLRIGEGDSTTTCRSTNEVDGLNNKILNLQLCIREHLKREQLKDCLLVLSDVQNSKTLTTFNLGCKTLIITRNKRIVSSLPMSKTTHIGIDGGLSRSECFQLFEKVLQCKRDIFPSYVTDIFDGSNRHPYLLTIIANNLRLESENQRNWAEWIPNLQISNIADNKFARIAKLSLKVLQSDEMKLYEMLVIFPHSIKIPLKLLAAMWDKTEREAKKILAKFDKYSIINSRFLPDESVACIMPYIYSSYLKANKEVDQTDLHQKVVNYYRIPEALTSRKEVDMVCFTNDYYFYHRIGYHLRESKNVDLFSKLFLDFGFLEKKLRSDGFPNTIGDLKNFRDEITNGDPYNESLLSELLEFLPNIEEMLFRSEDTCLLQYALMGDRYIYEEAVKQARVFYDKMWFSEKGHFHQRRQMVCLPNKAKLIQLPEPDICVIALDNNDVLLFDLALDYSNGPVYLTDNKHPIIKMELILENNYIITLDVKGNVKIWSLVDDRRRSASRKRNSRTKVNPVSLTQSPEMLKRKCKQVIEVTNRGRIQTFYVESLFGSGIDLHLAFANGDICIHSWNAKREQFEIKSVPFLHTECNIYYLSKILNKYYMVLSKSGRIYFYKLCDSSKTCHSFIWQDLPNLLYIGQYKGALKTYIFFVCRDKILQLSFAEQRFEFLQGELETVYEIDKNDSANSIICARLSNDGRYLVLGTEHGLIVFNTEQKAEVLRGNVSECIACVAIHPLDDNVYKYIIVCGLEHSKILNLFALRQLENNTIAWSHRLSNMTGIKNSNGTNNPQFEPDVWLQGNKLFDLNYSDSVLLIAADSKNRIHQLCTTDTKNWSILLPAETSKKITAITAFNNISFCGYENGDIFNITYEVFLPKFTEKSITFLQMINENILVASSKESQQSIVRCIDESGSDVQKIFSIDIYKCFTLFESYLILLDPRGGFIVADIKNEFVLLHKITDIQTLFEAEFALLAGCDLKNNYLILATICFHVFIYKFSIHDDKLLIKRYTTYKNSENSDESDKVTCITSSLDASILAVGFKSGTIEIYQIQQKLVTFIFRLLSHTSMIYDMQFSPNAEILVSCSEQICFWHVSYILNNPFDSGTKQKRRSSRFRSSNSPVKEVTEALGQLNQFDDNKICLLPNPWSNKRGPTVKPELLSCIKFVGNKAEIFYANDDFTQFNTIDNEGVYYHLCVHDISRMISSSVTGSNGHAQQDDDVIT